MTTQNFSAIARTEDKGGKAFACTQFLSFKETSEAIL